MVIIQNELIEKYLIAPIENPLIIKELTSAASGFCRSSIARLGYNLWSCLDGRCAVLAYQPLFECQHGDAPFYYCWIDRYAPGVTLCEVRS